MTVSEAFQQTWNRALRADSAPIVRVKTSHAHDNAPGPMPGCCFIVPNLPLTEQSCASLHMPISARHTDHREQGGHRCGGYRPYVLVFVNHREGFAAM